MTSRLTLLVVLAMLGTPATAQRRKATPEPVAAPAPPPPTVRAGVDLWRAGDWAGAVAIWQPFAAAGDADAMFNMGQAYKLGRAVPVDKAVARDWYRKAAAKDHLPAQANLGILLFQAGEKPEAARWLKSAADRGEMRAQYVLGVAHWNGDGVVRSMPLAYAYLARSSAQGLTEATSALNNLTRTIAPVDRANGWAIATSLAAGKGVPTNFAVASAPAAGAPRTAADLNRQTLDTVLKPLPAAPAALVAQAAAPPVMPQPVPPPPKPATAPARQVAVAAPPTVVSPPPAVTPAPAPAPTALAVAPAAAPPASSERATAPPVRSVELPASAAVQTATIKPSAPSKPVAVAEKPPEKAPPAKTRAVEAAPVGWRVQLGAFGKRSQAEAAWTEIKTKQKAAVGTAKPIYAPGTTIVKLQMGPYKTRTEAKDACAKLAFSGRACFVTES